MDAGTWAAVIFGCLTLALAQRAEIRSGLL